MTTNEQIERLTEKIASRMSMGSRFSHFRIISENGTAQREIIVQKSAEFDKLSEWLRNLAATENPDKIIVDIFRTENSEIADITDTIYVNIPTPKDYQSSLRSEVKQTIVDAAGMNGFNGAGLGSLGEIEQRITQKIELKTLKEQIPTLKEEIKRKDEEITTLKEKLEAKGKVIDLLSAAEGIAGLFGKDIRLIKSDANNGAATVKPSTAALGELSGEQEKIIEIIENITQHLLNKPYVYVALFNNLIVELNKFGNDQEKLNEIIQSLKII